LKAFKKQPYFTVTGEESKQSIQWIKQYAWCLDVVEILSQLREDTHTLNKVLSWDFDDTPFDSTAEVWAVCILEVSSS
jgi:hypothetical protein